MTSTTDESEDENIQMLLDAVDPNLLQNDPYKVQAKNDSHMKSRQDESATPEIKNEIIKQPKSQRYIELNDESIDSFKVSPSMQHFFAKKLSSMVSEQIEFINSVGNNEISHKKRKKTKPRIKLLNDCDVPISDVDTTSDFQCYPMKKPVIKRRLIEPNELTEKEKCKAVAIEPNFIYSGVEIKHWSNRSKAQIFQYTKSKNESKYVYVEPEFFKNIK